MKELTEVELLERELIQNPIKFTIAIEKVKRELGTTYIESIIHYCEENSIELDIVGDLVTNNLKEKIQAEATYLNFLPKTGVLPI